MKHATQESVQGNFDNFTFGSNRFFKKGKDFWVNIKGPNNKFSDYQIKYTFGFEPLQQYMVEFPDGRVQLIPFAWDSREKINGGQRWFNLYPEQTQEHQEFYWTNTGQNWNYMCADCHSTNVDKNFSVDSNSYQTTFSEINVGCEACHGAASEHLNWSKNPHKKSLNLGFDGELSKSVLNWELLAGNTTLSPEKIEHSQQAIVCAQCHSRHVQISDKNHVASKSLGDRYLLNLIDSQRYYPDGQVYDEDYVYGSFLQSKMNKNGVDCSNCHNPHSAKLVMPEEQVCLQCHQASSYDTTEHHHHKSSIDGLASEGAKCVNCHMPETTYMQIDKRRDHGWHIPRPDFANQLGTPDTCLNCHKDKDSHWSLDKVTQWYPKRDPKEEKHFAPVFSAIDNGYQGAAQALSHVAQNINNADIIRASALERMNGYSDKNTIVAIARGVRSPDENVRVGAVRGAEGLQLPERWRILSPLLTDKVLAVRTETARVLMPLWQSLSPQQQDQLSPALEEYLEVQNFNSDRGFSHTNKANVFVYQQKYQQAEQAYKTSIRIEPYFANAYVNLADLYRRLNQNDKSLKTLMTGLQKIPDVGNLPYSIGLAYIRNKKIDKAVEYLDKATKIEPNNTQFLYVLGLALESIEPEKAQQAIQKAYQVGGNPQHLYALCEMQIRHQSIHVRQCINQLKEVAPPEVVKALEEKLRKENE
ncbi:MAG: putative CXXCH cytochrome family protein [Gammaproteobacteria bacterium]|jgi:predicted CXXCH cytochrome family protein